MFFVLDKGGLFSIYSDGSVERVGISGTRRVVGERVWGQDVPPPGRSGALCAGPDFGRFVGRATCEDDPTSSKRGADSEEDENAYGDLTGIH